jgi:hypothetical protein
MLTSVDYLRTSKCFICPFEVGKFLLSSGRARPCLKFYLYLGTPCIIYYMVRNQCNQPFFCQIRKDYYYILANNNIADSCLCFSRRDLESLCFIASCSSVPFYTGYYAGYSNPSQCCFISSQKYIPSPVNATMALLVKQIFSTRPSNDCG